MKKTKFIGLCLILSLCTCNKAEKTQMQFHDSTAVLLNSDAKGSNYSIVIAIGHHISECGGRCVRVNGQWCHFDCMSYGNVCAISTVVNLIQNSGNNYTATTLDSTALTNEDFFNMPSRSLFVEYDEKNNEVWLNISAQLVFRDSTTRQFTFTNLFYSNSAYFTNN